MSLHTHPRTNGADESRSKYESCLIRPMGRNGEQAIHLSHIIDAFLVGLLVFFAVVLGDVLPTLLAGESAYLSISEILQRTPTGLLAFGLTFVFQWLRARGIDVLEWYDRFRGRT